jgi:hypothetical protein
MATPYSDIYTKSSILFDDSNLLSILADEEYEELLQIFLNKAKTLYFKSCTKDLTDVDNEEKQFNEDLSEEEQWILAEGIKLVWLEKQLYKEKELRNRISTKDYSLHSPANLIEKLTGLVNETRKTLKSYVVDYTFNNFSGFN